MRKLISLEKLVARAREDNTDLADLAIDEEEVFDVNELDDFEENPESDEE